MRPIALVAFTREDAAAVRRLARLREDAAVHLPHRLAGEGEIAFAEAGEHLRRLFRSGHAIVGFCAAGILVRALAPVLADKRREPPVLVVDATRRRIVPLLGAHRGGHALARELARQLDGEAVRTDRSRTPVPLDVPPADFGCTLPTAPAAWLAAVADGVPVRLEDPGGWLPAELRAALRLDPQARLVFALDWRRREPAPELLVWHPRVLVVGVGTSRGAPAEAVIALVERTLDEAGLAAESIACIVSLDLKMDEPAIHRLAERLGVPARFFTAAELAREAAHVPFPSAEVEAAVGTPSVAEAAALRAVGPEGELVVAKRRNAVATCAVARARRPLRADAVGRPRGVLRLVGLGPGDARWRTRAAEEALATATDIVGYEGYLELLGELAEGRTLHPFPLGRELARCRHALRLAAEGRSVALVSSGDVGIYAMASPLVELLAEPEDPRWPRLALEIVPGISAMQAAAAASGAPLGHDFAVISLSDLLTPIEIIRGRLEAAARADLVLALYNPASTRRRALLEEALALLRRHRPPDTPVVMGRRLARKGERVDIVPLSELDPARVDMTTVLIVGSSRSRCADVGLRTLVWTPRGYAP